MQSLQVICHYHGQPHFEKESKTYRFCIFLTEFSVTKAKLQNQHFCYILGSLVPGNKC